MNCTTHSLRFVLRATLGFCLMALSSCSVTRQPLSTIYFPDAESAVVSEESPELTKLAQKLSSKLPFELDSKTDNLGLYAFVTDWLGTPYRFGSMSKRGTDCSGFVYNLYQKVYDGGFRRGSAADIMRETERVSKKDLREGDLVFFDIRNRRGGLASHVGVYLKDGRFVHASTRSGVIISSLTEGYYKRTYLGAGRID